MPYHERHRDILSTMNLSSLASDHEEHGETASENSSLVENPSAINDSQNKRSLGALNHGIPPMGMLNLSRFDNPNRQDANRLWKDASHQSKRSLPPGLFNSPTEPNLSTSDQGEHTLPGYGISYSQGGPVSTLGSQYQHHIHIQRQAPKTSEVHQPKPVNAINIRTIQDNLMAVETLASGHGAPRPLTAGPPGQRPAPASKANGLSSRDETRRYVERLNRGGIDSGRVEFFDSGHKSQQGNNLSDISIGSEPDNGPSPPGVGVISRPSKSQSNGKRQGPPNRNLTDMLAALDASPDYRVSVRREAETGDVVSGSTTQLVQAQCDPATLEEGNGISTMDGTIERNEALNKRLARVGAEWNHQRSQIETNADLLEMVYISMERDLKTWNKEQASQTTLTG